MLLIFGDRKEWALQTGLSSGDPLNVKSLRQGRALVFLEVELTLSFPGGCETCQKAMASQLGPCPGRCPVHVR